MSSAQIQKLQALLRRVEERRGQPRLHAVTAVSPRESSPTVPDLERAVPPAAHSASPPVAHSAPPSPSVARSAPPSVALASEPAEPPTTPPAPLEPPRTAPSISPLETAMARLDDSGPLELPAPAAPAVSLVEPKPLVSVPQDMLLTHRPEAEPLEQPVELTQPKRPLVEREPTIEFETAKVRVNARELRAVGEPMATPAGPAPGPAAVPPAPLSAPSQTLEAAPLAQGAQPARSISSARVEVPKTFGELLDQSLALRPRG